MANENVELIDEEVITLYDDKNQPVKFREVACVEYNEEFYALVQPVEPMEGLDDDEALIFKLVEQPDDTDLFVPVDDEAVLEAVFEEYLRAVADSECGCGCGCGCDDCGDDCGDDCECGEHHCECGCDHEQK